MRIHSIHRSALLLALWLGCGGESAPAEPDARPALPDTGAYLATGRYDCTATGPFVAPTRPHDLDCFSDAACTSRLVTGHRIANPFAPENSLSALRAAILLGVDIVETDIRMTIDGEVVLIHDGDVGRTTGAVGDIDALTLAEVRALRLVPESDDPPGDFSCDGLPTLDEVFALSRGQIVVELEVKDTLAGVVAAEYLRDNGLYGEAFLLCDTSECEAIRAAVPDARIMTRPGVAAEVEAAIAYDPAPELVHIDALNTFLTQAVVDQIHGVGAKVYANAFLQGDGPALASADLDAYVRLYEDGLDVIQAEYPHWGLQALGRLEPESR